MPKAMILWGSKFINLDAIAEMSLDTRLVRFEDGGEDTRMGYFLHGVDIFVYEGTKQYEIVDKYVKKKLREIWK